MDLRDGSVPDGYNEWRDNAAAAAATLLRTAPEAAAAPAVAANAAAQSPARAAKCKAADAIRTLAAASTPGMKAVLQVVRFALGKKYVGAVEAELPAARIPGRTARNIRPNFGPLNCTEKGCGSGTGEPPAEAAEFISSYRGFFFAANLRILSTQA